MLQDGNTALIRAVREGQMGVVCDRQLDIVKHLLKCNADLNVRDEVTQPTESNRLLVN